MALEMHAGNHMLSTKPSLPEDTTVAILALRRFSIAAVIIGLTESQGSKNLSLPRLRLTAAIGSVSLSSSTRSSPCAMSTSKALAHGTPAQSCSAKTRIATRFALRAMPSKLEPFPAAIPPTCVPCSHSGAKVHGTPAPELVSVARPFGQVDTAEES